MPKAVDSVNHRPGAPEDDVLEAIHAVMHQYRAQQYRVLRDGPHGVTHMESKVLGYFGRQPGATQSELAQHSGRDKAQLARLIKGLRERGLLLAEPDAADRRNLQLTLSAEGQAVQRALRQQARKLSASAVAGFSAQERQTLLALLQRVRGHLDGRD
jgi:DNA-binding MarR family transcriptional regulator